VSVVFLTVMSGRKERPSGCGIACRGGAPVSFGVAAYSRRLCPAANRLLPRAGAE
jgi:hypothetical protein